MKPLLTGALLMSLASPGCADPDGDLPRPYSRIEVPTALLASADAKRRGQEVFQRSCALCHGVRGDGQGDRREGLARPPRNFTDPGWRRSTTPRRVFYAIREGITGTPMPAAPSLSDQQTWDVTAFVLSLGETR